jgi:hypothetical protein
MFPGGLPNNNTRDSGTLRVAAQRYLGPSGGGNELPNFGGLRCVPPSRFLVSVILGELKWSGINSCGSVDSERVRQGRRL